MNRRALLTLLAAAPLAGPAFAQDKPITVGGKAYTEQQLMAEITSQFLRANGYTVDTRAGLGTAALRQAQESGQIDVYWEYTGTSLITFNKITERLTPEQTYLKVKELDAAKGLVWLNPSKVNSTYALAMRGDDAKALGIASLSDLAKAVKAANPPMKFACNAEFYGRPDGLAPLEKEYGFEFGRPNVVRMDTGLVYQALRDQQVLVGLVLALDGRIPALNLTVLKDDRSFFPFYASTPVARKATLDRYPDLAGLLNRLSAKMEDGVVSHLNGEVDLEKKPVAAVAKEFLQSSGLISPS